MAVKSWSESQALSRSSPTLETEGMSLRRVKGYRVFITAPSGQTLSGSGSLKAWVYDTSTSTWVRNPSLDLTLGSSHSGLGVAAFPDCEVTVPEGRVLYAASSVTVSSGTAVTISIRAR